MGVLSRSPMYPTIPHMAYFFFGAGFFSGGGGAGASAAASWSGAAHACSGESTGKYDLGTVVLHAPTPTKPMNDKPSRTRRMDPPRDEGRS
jgi:hypothetical protein